MRTLPVGVDDREALARVRASRPDVGHQRILGHAARELPRRRRASQHWVAALGLRTEMKAADAWPIKYIWFLWYTILFVIIPCNPAFADRNRRVYVCNVCEGLEFIDSDESFERVAGGTRSEAIVGTLQRCSGLRIGVGNADLITLGLLGCFTFDGKFCIRAVRGQT